MKTLDFYFKDYESNQPAEPESEKPASSTALILCETRRALFVAILLRMNGVIGEDADLLLTDSEDLAQFVQELTEANLFNNIWQVSTSRLFTRVIRMDDEDRKAEALHPEAFIPQPFGTTPYDDLWLGSDGLCGKYYYYTLVNCGKAPEVHYFEGGTGSYHASSNTLKRDCIPHDQFGENAFEKHRHDVWLFKPELFQSDSASLEARQIPHAALTAPDFRDVARQVFDVPQAPQKPFVFFEQCFADCDGVTNDLEVVKRIADVIGKENIEVWLHPGTGVDRFSPFGFTVRQPGRALWEMALIEGSVALDEVVFITLDSAEAFSSLTMLGKPSRSIVLNRMIWGSYNGKDDPLRIEHLKAVAELSNGEEMKCHIPGNREELDIILRHYAQVGSRE